MALLADTKYFKLSEFRHDPWIFGIAEAYYRMPFNSGVLVFQHNTKSNKETRYYHVDAFVREFKAFMYLDEVTEGNGPFTYLRGTHRSHLTRLRKQLVGNRDDNRSSMRCVLSGSWRARTEIALSVLKRKCGRS